MTITTVSLGRGEEVKDLEKAFGATGVSEALQLFGPVTLQVTGTASAATIRAERSTRDPLLGDPNWAPVHTYNADPSAAPAVVLLDYPGASWWRMNCTALTFDPGEFALATIQGHGA